VQRYRPVTHDRFRLFPVRSPLLRESRQPYGCFDVFSSRYLDGSVPWVSLPQAMCSPCGCTGFYPYGLPHSATPGSQDVCSSPGLFAAYHGLPRRPAPRHPPWTLSRLTILSLHPSLAASRIHPHSAQAPLETYLVKEQTAVIVSCLASNQAMGLARIELATSRLSGVRSNQLSYRPVSSFI
jgi:hypothetical protein